MRVAMFTDSWETDGVSNSVRRSKLGLEKRGHKVYVFTASGNRTGWHGDTYYFKGISFPFYRTYKLCFFPEKVEEILRRLKIDIVHVHTPAFVGVKGMLAAYRCGIPSVFTYHTDFLIALRMYITLIPPSLLKILAKIFLDYFVKEFDAIIFPSQFTKRMTLDWLKFHGKHFVFPTGIDTERFRPRTRMFRLSILDELEKEGKRILLTLGRVAPEKNFPLLFEAVEHLPDDYVFLVAGEGPLYKEYKSIYESEKVRFLGFVADECLPALYSGADCFVIASKFETQGMVVHEAMACGCPVAAIDYGALPEFVTDQSGRLFRENARSIAEAILYLSDNSDLDPRGAAEDNNNEIFINRLEKVYRSIIRR